MSKGTGGRGKKGVRDKGGGGLNRSQRELTQQKS
jgi:hypothetical protein